MTDIFKEVHQVICREKNLHDKKLDLTHDGIRSRGNSVDPVGLRASLSWGRQSVTQHQQRHHILNKKILVFFSEM